MADFHTSLGTVANITYTCPNCGEAPAHASNWVRCVVPSVEGQYGGTNGKRNKGHWRCPWNACFHRWKKHAVVKTKWKKRLLVLPGKDTEGSRPDKPARRLQQINRQKTKEIQCPEQKAMLVFWGPATKKEKHMLTLVKTAKPVKQIEVNGKKEEFNGGKALNEAIVAAVHQFNILSDEQVIETCPMVLKERAKHDKYEDNGVRMHCEDPRLSSNSMTGLYCSIDVPDSLPTLADQDRESLLDLLLGHMDIDHAPGNPWDRASGAKKKPLNVRWEEAKERQDRYRSKFMPTIKFIPRATL